jgi:hypothetical protein
MTIAGWMNDCDQNHPRCNSTILHPHLPKRIIDLTGGNILLREDSTEVPFYACLSHCWGPSDHVTKTTSANLEQYKLAIPANDLTKTFRDAVDICLRLNIAFLWIDSLCIIQDSESDWWEQSGKMASIYQNARLTIAATNASESAGGCYASTKPEFLAKCIPGTNIHVRQQPPTFPTHWSQHNVEEWPLLNRGWCYQEMRLSWRVLHFCSQEVIWQCAHKRRSESGCSDEDTGKDEPRYNWSKYDAVPYWKLAQDPRRLWYRTVQEYSRLQLTFGKDRLPALAALTQNMENLRVNDRFLAGLWKNTLLLDMLWMVWPRPKTGRLATWRGPTWSWVSSQGQVIWESSVDSVLSFVQVVDVQHSTEGPAHMGEIREATITLRGPLMAASINDGRVCFDTSTPLFQDITIENEKNDYVFSSPGDDQIASGTKVWIVPIGFTRVNYRHTGIVLLNRQHGSLYERIAYVELRHRAISELKDSHRNDRYENLVEHGKFKEAKTDLVNDILRALPSCTIKII